MPRGCSGSEFVGAVAARRRYREARARACEIEASMVRLWILASLSRKPQPRPARSRPGRSASGRSISALGVQALDGLTAHDRTRVSVSANGRHLADVDVENRGLDISRDRMINSVLENRPAEDWLALAHGIPVAQASAALREDLRRRMSPGSRRTRQTKSARHRPGSILLVARRTTVDLRRQLAALAAVAKPRPFEVIVLPQATGLDLSSLEAEFPGLRRHTAIEPGCRPL